MRITERKIVDLIPSNIQEQVISYLDKSGYRIIQKSKNAISFDDKLGSGWNSRSNMRYYKITSARFDFALQETKTEVSLVYDIDVVFEIFFIIISTVSAIFIAHVFFVVSLIVILNLLVKFYITKNDAEDMLGSVSKMS